MNEFLTQSGYAIGLFVFVLESEYGDFALGCPWFRLNRLFNSSRVLFGDEEGRVKYVFIASFAYF